MRSLLNRAVRVAYPFGVVRGIHRGPLRGMKYRVAPGMGFTYAWELARTNGASWGVSSRQAIAFTTSAPTVGNRRCTLRPPSAQPAS